MNTKNTLDMLWKKAESSTDTVDKLPRKNSLLYHYTDTQALINILQNKILWAAHTNYLNDKYETITEEN